VAASYVSNPELFAQEERGAYLGVSKKDAGLRRRELLGTGTGSLAEALCRSCRERARQLLRSKAAGDLLVEVGSSMPCSRECGSTSCGVTLKLMRLADGRLHCSICNYALQVVAGGSDGILQELAPAELASLRDTVVSLSAEPRSAPGDLACLSLRYWNVTTCWTPALLAFYPDVFGFWPQMQMQMPQRSMSCWDSTAAALCAA